MLLAPQPTQMLTMGQTMAMSLAQQAAIAVQQQQQQQHQHVIAAMHQHHHQQQHFALQLAHQHQQYPVGAYSQYLSRHYLHYTFMRQSSNVCKIKVQI
jgi:hypothetical protein